MMLRKILVDFYGASDGISVEKYYAGTIVDVSDYLMDCIPSHYTASPIMEPAIQNKAIITDPRPTLRLKK